MPTASAFKNIPPFPTDVPIADIPVISYTHLKSGTGDASNAFFEACREQGFILLDLRGDEQGDRLLEAAESMFRLNTALFNLGREELVPYEADFPKDVIGYKSTGVIKTSDCGGKRDMQQWYTLSRDEILDISSTRRRNPEIFTTHREQCQQFFIRAHSVMQELLAHLDKHLGLAAGTLDSIMPLDKPSDTSLRLLHTPPATSEDISSIHLGGHCDVGTVTMLFNVVGGLQILPAGSENINDGWRYVRPQPGCAIVNIGDSLVELSGGILRSSLHRVATPPGEQAKVVRQSLAYPVRPAHEGTMKRLNGSAIPPLADGEREEICSVDEWAYLKTKELVDGKKPQTKGGRPVRLINAGRVVTMVA